MVRIVLEVLKKEIIILGNIVNAVTNNKIKTNYKIKYTNIMIPFMIVNMENDQHKGKKLLE